VHGGHTIAGGRADVTKPSPRVAFVASGGAARGIAHLGVLRACEDLGIAPQIFVGTSAGAIVNVFYAQNTPLDVLVDAYRPPWRRRYPGSVRLGMRTFFGMPRWSEWLHPGHLVSGVFSIDKLERYLAKRLPTNDFRKLPYPVMVTAVDIDRGNRVVFGHGHDDAVPISQAVAASCCVPGLFRPYRIGQTYHVDGEVARTLSADLAVEAGADVVIVSNIYRPEKRDPVAQRSVARQGALRVLRQAINIVLTQKEQTGLELHARKHPEVVFLDVAPNVGMIGYLNQVAARSLIMRGYRTALRELAAAKVRGVFGDIPTG